MTGARIVSSPRIESRRLATDVIVTEMSGRIDAKVCTDQLPQFEALLREQFEPRWIIDVLAITGFDAGAVNRGNAWFKAFRAQEGSQIAFVCQLSAAKMAVRALSFSVRVDVTVFENLNEALRSLGVAGPAGKFAARR